jgi:uncharacterized protein YegP (UPF0339 family)
LKCGAGSRSAILAPHGKTKGKTVVVRLVPPLWEPQAEVSTGDSIAKERAACIRMTWEFYQDRLGEWQWRKFQDNKVVAVSAAGFASRQACIDDAKRRGYHGA